MNRKDRIAENINDLLPDSSDLLGSDGMEARQSLVEQKATDIHQRKSARELAKARFAIRAEQEAEVARHAVQKHQEQKNKLKRPQSNNLKMKIRTQQLKRQ